jgi:hypothetical protein
MHLGRSRIARAAAGAAAAVLLGCHHHQRADLQIVLHARETPKLVRIVGYGVGYGGAVYEIHWSIDLVETGGRNCTLTAVDQVIRSSGHPDVIRHDDATSGELHGVSYDSWVDLNLPLDPTIRGYGIRKVAGTYWSTGWNFQAPPDHVETLVIDMIVHYRDSAGERVVHSTFGPGLTLEE